MIWYNSCASRHLGLGRTFCNEQKHCNDHLDCCWVSLHLLLKQSVQLMMTGCYVWSFVQSARFWIITWSILIWSILKVLVDRNCFLWKYGFFLPMLIIVYGRVKAEKLVLALMNTVVLWTTSSGFEAFFGLLWIGERSISVDDLLICRGKSKEATDMWEKWCNYIKRKIESVRTWEEWGTC